MGCCGSTPKIDNINEEVALQNDKLDKLVDKVVRLEETNMKLLAESKAANEELRNLLGTPWAEQLRRERILLEQVLHRRWPLGADQLKLEPVVYKSSSATRDAGIPSDINVQLPGSIDPAAGLPQPVPLGYVEQSKGYY